MKLNFLTECTTINKKNYKKKKKIEIILLVKNCHVDGFAFYELIT